MVFTAAPAIAAGPDGALWFTESAANKIGRITTAGAVSTVAIPGPIGGGNQIAAGPDGAMWFAYSEARKIVRVTTDTFPRQVPPPSTRTVVAALTSALNPTGAASIGAILRAGAYPAPLSAPSAGTAQILWYQVPAGARVSGTAKPVLAASGSKIVSRAGKTTVRVRLTAKGKALLSHARRAKRRVSLTAKGPSPPRAARRPPSCGKITLKL